MAFGVKLIDNVLAFMIFIDNDKKVTIGGVNGERPEVPVDAETSRDTSFSKGPHEGAARFELIDDLIFGGFFPVGDVDVALAVDHRRCEYTIEPAARVTGEQVFVDVGGGAREVDRVVSGVIGVDAVVARTVNVDSSV